MKAKLEVNSIKLSQKYIDNELVQQSSFTHKKMQQKINEKALSKAFQLYSLGA
jgi:hypothetical protein